MILSHSIFEFLGPGFENVNKFFTFSKPGPDPLFESFDDVPAVHARFRIELRHADLADS